MTDPRRIIERAEFYRPAMLGFLRDICAIPSESCREGAVVERVKCEM